LNPLARGSAVLARSGRPFPCIRAAPER
jgi:hypothetical protein